jgi:hypothetical protein
LKSGVILADLPLFQSSPSELETCLEKIDDGVHLFTPFQEVQNLVSFDSMDFYLLEVKADTSQSEHLFQTFHHFLFRLFELEQTDILVELLNLVFYFSWTQDCVELTSDLMEEGSFSFFCLSVESEQRGPGPV